VKHFSCKCTGPKHGKLTGCSGTGADVTGGLCGWCIAECATRAGEETVTGAGVCRVCGCTENASLASQVESMVMRIESLTEELAKPEDVRLREVLDALDGRAVIFDGLGARVRHLVDEMDQWIARAGAAERRLNVFGCRCRKRIESSRAKAGPG
jgi:hypothetical protein